MARHGDGWFGQLLGIFAALLLSVVPLPEAIAPFRPDFVPLAFLYWSLLSARSCGLLTAFWAGLALDALTGALIGEHALALLLVVYLSQRFYLRIRVFPASQLTLTVTGLLSLYEFMLFWIDGVAGRTVPIVERWGPVVSGALLWMLVLLLLERGRQQAQARL
jgi:rod shape-determining protein MreD